MNDNISTEADPLTPLNPYEAYPPFESYVNYQMNAIPHPYPYMPIGQPEYKNDRNYSVISNTGQNGANTVMSNGEQLMDLKTESIDRSILYEGPHNPIPNPTSSNYNIEDTKPDIDIKPVITRTRKRKPNKNGKTSNYLSKKIQDKEFPFYACAICNINYTALHELDMHVTTHKDRVTSYDLKIKNQIRRKRLKQEKKKLKKMKKIKTEMDVEIKPEEGYIGSEKAIDYQNVAEDFLCNPVTAFLSTMTELNADGNNSIQENDTSNVAGPSNIETGPNNESGPNNNEDGPNNNETGPSNNETGPNNNEDGPNNNVIGPNIDTTGPNSNEIGPNTIEHDNKIKELANQVASTLTQNFNHMQNAQSLINLEKIFKCHACQKQFSLSYYLKLHVRSHTDEKPYKCKECGQSFITASKLGRHNKRIHLAIRYQCRICYKYFTRFEYLTRHFDKKHADEKLEGEPYDYNAILPYLKELEEQLREKTESKEEKPKTEDLWPETLSNITMAQNHSALDPSHFNAEHSDHSMDHKDFVNEDNKDFELDPNLVVSNLDVSIEVVKVDSEEVKVEGMVEVKKEKVEEQEIQVEVEPDEPVKDESLSDDDYFPSNTWASTPQLDMTPTSPPTRRRRNASTNPIKCDVCQKELSSVTYMRIHMRTHTGEKPYKCYICNRGFITASKMNRHVLTHSESWGDGKGQISVEDLKVKEEKETSGESPENKEAILKRAKEKFTKKPKKKERSGKHQKRPHACEFCQKRFLHIETLLVHKKSHEGEVPTLKCYYCLMAVDDEATLKTHEATHVGPKPFQCTICGKSYKNRETMVYHRKNHEPDKEFICDICSKTFNAACKLQRHIVSHRTDKFVLRYECPVCAHMFHTKYHVQMHLTTHQKEGLILEENRNAILAMVLQNARKIPKHTDGQTKAVDTALIPADERSRVCNICGEVFQHFYYLEEHLKSHGSKIAIEDETKPEEKKHTCQVCNKSFKLHYYLKLHSFTHTKEKPYICQQCGKGFITKGKLKRHLETHAGLKKYQCHICYKFFTRPSYLRIHIRTIHGTQDYNFRGSEAMWSSESLKRMVGHDEPT